MCVCVLRVNTSASLLSSLCGRYDVALHASVYVCVYVCVMKKS